MTKCEENYAAWNLLIGSKTKNWPKNVSGWKLYSKQFFNLSEAKNVRISYMYETHEEEFIMLRSLLDSFQNWKLALKLRLPFRSSFVSYRRHCPCAIELERPESKIPDIPRWRLKACLLGQGTAFYDVRRGSPCEIGKDTKKNKKCDEGKMHPIKVNTKLLRIRWYLL